jgi:hypothetical protein
MYIGLHVKYPLFLPDFTGKLNLLGTLSKNTAISNFVKTLQVGTELFHMETDIAGRTYRHDEVISRFSRFYENAQQATTV